MSAQHLRPLLAFVVVAIVGAVVFGNGLRAQDVLGTIRDGASNVLAGTPLLHDPLYVVEDGERFAVAEPQVEPSTSPVPESPVDGSVSSSGVTTAPAPPVASESATPSTAPAAPDADGAQTSGNTAGGGTPDAPQTPATSKGHGPQTVQDQPGSSGTSGSDVGHQVSGHGKGRAEDHGTRGHQGDDKRISARVREDHEVGRGHDDDKPGHREGHDKAHAGSKAKGLDRLSRWTPRAHVKGSGRVHHPAHGKGHGHR